MNGGSKRTCPARAKALVHKAEIFNRFLREKPLGTLTPCPRNSFCCSGRKYRACYEPSRTGFASQFSPLAAPPAQSTYIASLDNQAGQARPTGKAGQARPDRQPEQPILTAYGTAGYPQTFAAPGAWPQPLSIRPKSPAPHTLPSTESVAAADFPHPDRGLRH